MLEPNINNETAEQENNAKRLAELEALLFIHGEPVPYKNIADVLSIPPGELGDLLAQYKELLSNKNRGLTLLEEGDSVQLITKPQFGELLQRFIEEDLRESLTPASLETVSLIAYLGPVDRSTIEYVRGVNSSFILRQLLLRGLVNRERGPGGAYLYSPSADLLRFLGVESQADLPEYQTYQSLREYQAESDETETKEEKGEPKHS